MAWAAAAVAVTTTGIVLLLKLGFARRLPEASRGYGFYACVAAAAGRAIAFLPIDGEVGGGEIADCGSVACPDRTNNVDYERSGLSPDVRRFCASAYRERAWWLLLPTTGIVAVGAAAAYAHRQNAGIGR